MSASNWTICPMCIKRSKELIDKFVKKYYGKIDGFVYNKMLEEINKAFVHVKSYSSDEYEPDKKILKLMEEREITVKLGDEEYNENDLLQNGKISSCLREDYEQGVDSKGDCYMYYEGECDCGFNKNFKFNEDKHNIVDKETK